MKPVLFADEMQKIDTYTMQTIGVEGCVLMERAALFAAEIIKRHIKEHNITDPQIALLCGNGNNGGDGYALARLLWEDGYNISVIAPFFTGKKSRENEKQLNILQQLGMSVATTFEKKEYDIIVDALFGIGLNRPLIGEYQSVIEEGNQLNGWKLAIDIPSGLHTDTGTVMGSCIKADCTVTMQYEKLGLYLNKGREFAGKIYCKNIGIFDTKEEKPYRVYAYDEPVSALLPKRPAMGNKGTFGKVLVIAGDVDMAGACVLCAKAAYRSGCGMVKIITKPENREIIQKTLPEAMLFSMEYDNRNDYPKVLESIKWADSIVIGPGMGRNEKAHALLEYCISNAGIPMVIDADALWLLAKYPNLKEKLADRQFVLTPHIGEFAGLTGQTVPDIKKDLYSAACQYTKEMEGTLVLKDAATLICDKRHSYQIINTVGNDGMATAGSGDVLAGIIGSLMARGMNPFESAGVGVYWHGLAGDIAAEKNGKNALMANDIIEYLYEAEMLRNGETYD